MKWLVFILTCCNALAGAFSLSDAGVMGLPQVTRQSLVADYYLQEGIGQHFYNFAKFPQLSVNLIQAPEQNFGRSTFWNKGSYTVTDRYSLSPDGYTNGSRMMIASGNLSIINVAPINWTNAPHTLSCWFISNTGGNQTNRFSIDDGGAGQFSGANLISNSWQRYSFTFTPAASTNKTLQIRTGASSFGFDVSAWGIKLERGSSATDYEPANYQGWLGTTVFTDLKDPTWSSTYSLQFGATNYAATVGWPEVLSGVSLYGLVIWNKTNTYAANNPVLTTRDGNEAVDFGLNTTSTNIPAYFLFNNKAVTNSQISFITSNRWAIIAATYDGTNQVVYIDGQEVSKTNLTSTTAVLDSLWMGTSTFTQSFPGEIASALIYRTGHTRAQVLQTTYGLMCRARDKGISWTPVPKRVVWEGDSITAYSVNSYEYVATRDSTVRPLGWVQAQVGDTLTNYEARASADKAWFCDPRQKNIMSMFFGANDIYFSGSANTFTNMLISDCKALRAAGFKVIAYTVLPRNGMVTAARAAANAAIRGDTSFYDALADFAADPTMGCDNCYTNLTYYIDGVHPTVAGHAILAPICATALNSL